ncbi:unnamed protein product, partial [Iphiclides podalirius]
MRKCTARRPRTSTEELHLHLLAVLRTSKITERRGRAPRVFLPMTSDMRLDGTWPRKARQSTLKRLDSR